MVVKLEQESCYLNGELDVKEHKLDCCFFIGQCPPGMESFPLYEDPYYLVVEEKSYLASLKEVSVWDVVGKYQFIPTNESFDMGSTIHEIYDLIPNRAVKIIPLKDRLTRTVSLLCPRESERSHLTEVFLRLTQQRVDAWRTAQENKSP